MAIRSDTIAKAWRYLLQGEDDPEWNFEEWGDYYQDAIDMISAEIIGADLPYYMVTGATLTKNASDVYPLPDDLRALHFLAETDSFDEIFPMRDRLDTNTYRLVNHTVALNQWQGDLPATLVCDYRTFQPEITPAFAGDADLATAVPMAPLNNARGSRLIARVMVLLAQAKGEDLTAEQASMAKSLISAFVHQIDGFDQTQEQIVGT